PGVPITELLAEQKFLIAKAMGQQLAALEQQRAKDLVLHQKLVEWSQTADYSSKVNTYLTAELESQSNNEKHLNMAVENNLKLYDTPWFKYFIAFEPETYLSQVKIPVLALNGENDLQVAAVSNLGGIESALTKAGHSDFTIKTLPKLNHLFQTSDTGSTSEYGKLTESFSPLALQAMSEWLNQRF
ncbi:MAG: alpha/beta hydrolase family protein, partial [Marinicella sp.]